MSETTTNAEPVAAPFEQSTSVDETVKAMLLTNTGAHFMDSGDAYGRHHEENRRVAPWNKPQMQVRTGYVLTNVYHFLVDAGLERDDAVLALERDFYQYADRAGNRAYLQDMEQFSGDRDADAMAYNTYNGEFGVLTQDIQFVAFEHYGEHYALLHVHQGADIRGGYTAPRLFRLPDPYTLYPCELSFGCSCGWAAESCLDPSEYEYDTDANIVRCTDCGEDVLL